MPELPEVTTTVNGLNETLRNLKFTDVWSDYFFNTTSLRKDNIKNKKYFENFRKEIIGQKFVSAERRGKNVLIHLSRGKTILIHMKMTGHLLYGKYEKKISTSPRTLLGAQGESLGNWEAVEPESLRDPFNQFIHLVFSLSNGKHLAFSDMRKFAKVILFETEKRNHITDLSALGPEPLHDLSFAQFSNQLSKKPSSKIKSVLMDQSILAGIGNIYSDEILWTTGVHPERAPASLSTDEKKKMWDATKKILTESIKMGGDSMSDYRNIYGVKGGYQNVHKVYRRTKQSCLRKGCAGTIERKVIGGRSAHFCNVHQK